MNGIEYPTCAVCNKPVLDFYMNCHAGGIDCVARCHGDQQTVKVSIMELESAGPNGFKTLRAFEPFIVKQQVQGKQG